MYLKRSISRTCMVVIPLKYRNHCLFVHISCPLFSLIILNRQIRSLCWARVSTTTWMHATLMDIRKHLFTKSGMILVHGSIAWSPKHAPLHFSWSVIDNDDKDDDITNCRRIFCDENLISDDPTEFTLQLKINWNHEIQRDIRLFWAQGPIGSKVSNN